MGTRAFVRRHPLTTGIVLMFALTWPPDLALAAQSRGLLPFRIPPILGLFVGYGFVIAALTMTALTLGPKGVRDLLRRFLVWRVGLRWHVIALFGVPAIYLAALAINAAFGGAPDFAKVYGRRLFGDAAPLWYFIVPFFLIDLIANGEEIGWRGYILPRLQTRHTALVSSLIIGAIWAVWHIPKFLVAGNNNSVGLFFLDTMSKAVLFTWVYNNTKGSLLLASMLHASINTASVFLPVAAALTGELRSFATVVALEIAVATAITLASTGTTERVGTDGPPDVRSSYSRVAPEHRDNR